MDAAEFAREVRKAESASERVAGLERSSGESRAEISRLSEVLQLRFTLRPRSMSRKTSIWSVSESRSSACSTTGSLGELRGEADGSIGLTDLLE